MSAAVRSPNGNRNSGVAGGAAGGDDRRSRPARGRRRSRRRGAAGSCAWVSEWLPSRCPPPQICATSLGKRRAKSPVTKNVARTPSSSSVAQDRGDCGGAGPPVERQGDDLPGVRAGARRRPPAASSGIALVRRPALGLAVGSAPAWVSDLGARWAPGSGTVVGDRRAGRRGVLGCSREVDQHGQRRCDHAEHAAFARDQREPS